MYGPVSKDDALATLHFVVDRAGIRELDTAPHYGAGWAESLIGEANLPADVRITTKCGRLVRRRDDLTPGDPSVAWEGGDFFQLDGQSSHARNHLLVHDYSASGVRASVEESLQRLQIPRSATEPGGQSVPGPALHGLRLHDAETEARFQQACQPSNGAVAAMVRLRDKDGIVGRVSLGMNDAAFALRFLQQCPPGSFDELLLAGCWNLMDQSAVPVLQECERQNVSVVLAGVFGGGLLWGGTHYRYEAASADALAKAAQWRGLAAKHKVSLPAVALAFAMVPSVVSKLCIGCRSIEELQANLLAMEETVPTALWEEAYQNKLIPFPIDT